MLDLKKLERKLDEALAKETKESLSAWLKEKRKPKEKELGDNFLNESSLNEYLSSFCNYGEETAPREGVYPKVKTVNVEALTTLNVRVQVHIDTCIAYETITNKYLPLPSHGRMANWEHLQTPQYSKRTSNIIKKKTSNVSGSFFFINLVK